MPPWQGGGNMIADVTFEKTVYQPPPARFEAGTGNIADAVGLGAALDYVDADRACDDIGRYEHELLDYATERLLDGPGPAADRHRAGQGRRAVVRARRASAPRRSARALDQEGIAVRSGHHCAQPILRRFGLESHRARRRSRSTTPARTSTRWLTPCCESRAAAAIANSDNISVTGGRASQDSHLPSRSVSRLDHVRCDNRACRLGHRAGRIIRRIAAEWRST